MGILDSFERGLDRAVNGAFARTFRSGLQPVEITAALRREVDTHASPVARDRILVPNRFTVRMSATDHRTMAGQGPTLVEELTDVLTNYIHGQGYQTLGPVEIVLESDDAMTVGTLDVSSVRERTEVAWSPVLEVDGVRHPLRAKTVLGRGSDADITVDDDGISRQHLEITWDGTRAQARDLGSTNGSTLNGQRFTKAALPNDSVLKIGRTTIVFRLVATSQRSAR